MTDSDEKKRDPWAFRWQRTGAFHAWFQWVEWLGLTAALVTGTLKAKEPFVQWPIGILAGVSAWYLYNSGLVCLVDFIGSRIAKFGIPTWLRVPVIAIFGIAMVGCVIWAIVSVFMSLLEGGA